MIEKLPRARVVNNLWYLRVKEVGKNEELFVGTDLCDIYKIWLETKQGMAVYY